MFLLKKLLRLLSLSSNGDKRMESIDSIETDAYGTRTGLVSEKEEIKSNSIIKWYKKWLTLMMLQKKMLLYLSVHEKHSKGV